MKTYFLHDGKSESGPYSQEELKGKLERHTLIWKPGLKSWTPANQLDELKEMVVADTFRYATTGNSSAKTPAPTEKLPFNGKFGVAVFVLALLAALCFVVRNGV